MVPKYFYNTCFVEINKKRLCRKLVNKLIVNLSDRAITRAQAAICFRIKKNKTNIEVNKQRDRQKSSQRNLQIKNKHKRDKRTNTETDKKHNRDKRRNRERDRQKSSNRISRQRNKQRERVKQTNI